MDFPVHPCFFPVICFREFRELPAITFRREISFLKLLQYPQNAQKRAKFPVFSLINRELTPCSSNPRSISVYPPTIYHAALLKAAFLLPVGTRFRRGITPFLSIGFLENFIMDTKKAPNGPFSLTAKKQDPLYKIPHSLSCSPKSLYDSAKSIKVRKVKLLGFLYSRISSTILGDK